MLETLAKVFFFRVCERNIFFSRKFCESWMSWLPNIGSAKDDKHGVRENFAKVTFLFAKNGRSRIKEFWSTIICIYIYIRIYSARHKDVSTGSKLETWGTTYFSLLLILTIQVLGYPDVEPRLFRPHHRRERSWTMTSLHWKVRSDEFISPGKSRKGRLLSDVWWLLKP